LARICIHCAVVHFHEAADHARAALAEEEHGVGHQTAVPAADCQLKGRALCQRPPLHGQQLQVRASTDGLPHGQQELGD